MKHFSLAVLLSLGVTQLSLGADFEGQTEFSAVSISGQVEVRCLSAPYGKPTWAAVYCRANIIESKNNPELGAFDMAHFSHQTSNDVNRYELNVVHADGSTRKKTGPFNASEGRSKNWVNLWIDTVTQNPLLENGVNQVSYKLLKGKSVKEFGEFNVDVNWKGERRCQPQSFNGNGSDCETPSFFCDRYFRSQDLCR